MIVSDLLFISCVFQLYSAPYKIHSGIHKVVKKAYRGAKSPPLPVDHHGTLFQKQCTYKREWREANSLLDSV